MVSSWQKVHLSIFAGIIKKNYQMKSLFISLFVVLFASCNDDENTSQKDYTAENKQEILDYISDNDLDAIESATGIYYVINEAGTGEQPISSSNVTVAYKGYFTNGTVFDQSNANGISFNLNQVITGWTEGIQYFKEGGSGILLIPSSLGYGNSGNQTIPGGAVLVFDVNLISVN